MTPLPLNRVQKECRETRWRGAARKQRVNNPEFPDTILFTLSLPVFDVDGRQHTLPDMFAFRVMERFVVVEDVLSVLLVGHASSAANALTFQQVIEALGGRVIATIPTPAHRMFDVLYAIEHGPIPTGVL